MPTELTFMIFFPTRIEWNFVIVCRVGANRSRARWCPQGARRALHATSRTTLRSTATRTRCTTERYHHPIANGRPFLDMDILEREPPLPILRDPHFPKRDEWNITLNNRPTMSYFYQDASTYLNFCRIKCCITLYRSRNKCIIWRILFLILLIFHFRIKTGKRRAKTKKVINSCK